MESDIDADIGADALERLAANIESIAPRLREVAGKLREHRDIEASKGEIELIFSEYQELLNAI